MAHAKLYVASTVIMVVTALSVGVLTPVPAKAQMTDAEAVEAVVDAFHRALAEGDSTRALSLLADDVTILESGGVETKAQYRSGHIRGDMRFAQAVPRERGAIHVTVVGDVAWAHSTNVAQGTMGDREVDSQGAELMVLAREGGTWKIKAIHWSSRARRSG